VRQGTTHGDHFPSFVDYANTYLESNLPAEAPQRWGLAIFTTCDLVWQADAERALSAGLQVIDPHRFRPGDSDADHLQGAFVAIEPGTGAVRALVGGRAALAGDFDRATQARRQSGSSIKPIVYATALETGRGGDSVWTAGSIVPNVPITFQVEGKPWAPVNSDRTYSASITLLKALEHSVNVATVNLTNAIDPKRVAEYAERFGLGKLKPVLSIGLGSNEVTLLDLTDAYTAFPNAGVRVPARPVRAAIDANGKDLCAAPGKPVRVLAAPTAAVMVRMLEDVVHFGIANPLVSVYDFGRPVAGKTGTTNDSRDTWFVGFVPGLAAGVWVGYDLPRNLYRSASAVALPVWARVMKRLLDGFPKDDFPPDPRVGEVAVDAITGGLPRGDCPTVVRAPFILGTEPRWRCNRDHADDWIYLALEAMQRDSIDRAEADSAAAVLGQPAEAERPLIGPPAPHDSSAAGRELEGRARAAGRARGRFGASQQSRTWSFTSPVACMNAYTMVEPTKFMPRRFKSLLSASDSAVRGGRSFSVRRGTTIGLPPMNRHT
jgi:penicillin-binding protein 1A